MAETVTIDRAYFQTLLRRAESRATGKDLTTPIDLVTVAIPKVDHDNLLRTAREYTRLREALYRGGITPDTLEVLIKDRLSGEDSLESVGTYAATEDDSYPGDRSSFTQIPSGQPRSQIWTSSNGGVPLKSRWGRGENNPGFGYDIASYASDYQNEKEEGGWNANGHGKDRRQQYGRHDKRSILLSNLSDRTTIKDIVDVVLGGMLLDVHLRNDRVASVSFVEGENAQEFMKYAKRNDIYIHDKRVEIRWADRQFVLSPHVSNKISSGVTRNLFLRNINDRISEEGLRNDLEHIHNLVIISVSFRGQNAYVSTNSVNNAMFARTCMMSRAVYRGVQIEFFEDACSAPIPRLASAVKKENVPAKLQRISSANRFNLLNADESEDGSQDEHGEDESTISYLPNYKRSQAASWAETSVAAG